MDRKIKSFTLIELLVVISIMTIILAIAIPNVLYWIKKYNIESSTNSIYAFLQEARAKAFVEKIKLNIKINGSNLCIVCDLDDNDCTNAYGKDNIKCIQLKYKFTGKIINISKRGTFSGGPIYYPSNNNAQYDCVRISDIRVKIEKCNGKP